MSNLVSNITDYEASTKSWIQNTQTNTKNSVSNNEQSLEIYCAHPQNTLVQSEMVDFTAALHHYECRISNRYIVNWLEMTWSQPPECNIIHKSFCPSYWKVFQFESKQYLLRFWKQTQLLIGSTSIKNGYFDKQEHDLCEKAPFNCFKLWPWGIMQILCIARTFTRILNDFIFYWTEFTNYGCKCLKTTWKLVTLAPNFK